MGERINIGDKVRCTTPDEPEYALVGEVVEDHHRPLLGVRFFPERPSLLSGFFEHELRALVRVWPDDAS